MADPIYPERSAFRYDESRLDLATIGRLEFDRNYRIAQLPLVAPGHPQAIVREPGLDYVDGVYECERFSLVAPVASHELASAATCSDFVSEIMAASFGRKISSEITRRRSDRLHATVVGGLREADLGQVAKVAASFLHECGSIRMQVLGPFVGHKNSGRIYLPVIPELIDGKHAFGRLQSRAGMPVTGFYAIGLYNFSEELSAAETDELRHLIDDWKDRVLCEIDLRRLEILGTHDDLALSRRRIADISVQR